MIFTDVLCYSKWFTKNCSIFPSNENLQDNSVKFSRICQLHVNLCDFYRRYMCHVLYRISFFFCNLMHVNWNLKSVIRKYTWRWNTLPIYNGIQQNPLCSNITVWQRKEWNPTMKLLPIAPWSNPQLPVNFVPTVVFCLSVTFEQQPPTPWGSSMTLNYPANETNVKGNFEGSVGQICEI